jgi:hypothetical protein
LSVARDASPDEIKRAYRRLALLYHPDKSKAADAAARFKAIHEAYTVLIDADKRAAYDRYGTVPSDSSSASQQFRASFVLSGRIRALLNVSLELLFTWFVPFDTISKRAKLPTVHAVSSWRLFNTIRRTEGWRSLFRGTTLGVTSSLMYQGIRSAAQTQGFGVLSMPLAVCASYPLQLLCTCVRTRSALSADDAFRRIAANHGMWGFYAGLMPFLLYQTAFVGGAFLLESTRLNRFVLSKLQSRAQNNPNSTRWLWVQLAFLIFKLGLLTLALSPLKTVFVRMQLEVLAAGVGGESRTLLSSGILRTLKEIIGNEGWSALFRGFWADLVYSFGMLSLGALLDRTAASASDDNEQTSA